MKGSKALVTGASGFVGSAVVRTLRRRGGRVIAIARANDSWGFYERGPSVDSQADWRALLGDVEVVVHTAARVHVMTDYAEDPLAAFREINVAGTLELARQSAEVGVRRFVFISSIKVNGEYTAPGRPFLVDDSPAPADAYAISKKEAEVGLFEIARETGLEVAIIRPPLVYGLGVKGNFFSMMRWLARGVPLPLGAVERNRRSLVALDNLVDLIVTCIDHPAAANETFLVSDGEDLSTVDLLRRLASAMNVPAHLLPIPVWMLEACAAMLGRRAMVRRLCGNLQVDMSKAQTLLGWRPPIGVDEGLRRAASGFKG